MKVFLCFFLALTLVLAKWSSPSDLYSASYIFYPKSFYTDQSTGISHYLWNTHLSQFINYWQVAADGTVLSKTTFVDPEILAFHYARITGLGNGQDLYVTVMGVREPYDRFDQWFTESHDGGKTWQKFVRVPREDMDDRCDRFGDSILVTPDKSRVFIFYQLDCPDEDTKLAFVTRPPGSSIFTYEKVIYESVIFGQVRPSISAEFSMANGKQTINLFWMEYGTRERHVMVTKTQNNGLTWTEPEIVSGEDYAASFMSLTTASNSAVSELLVGTYAISKTEKVKLFYGKENAKFKTIEATVNPETLYFWHYRTNSMAICGTKERPVLVMLTHTMYNVAEYSVWDLNTMEVKRPGVPFGDVSIYAGVGISCHSRGDELIVSAMVHTLEDDGRYHIKFATDKLDLNSHA